MVDRRIRYLNPNGKIPPPGGGNQLLQELKPPALSDLQKERLPAVQPLAIEEPAVGAGMERAPVTREKKAVVVKEVQNTTPEPAALSADQTEALEQGDPQEGGSLSESDGRNGVASHTGGVVLTFERVEALQPARADSREKTASVLRQLAESVSSGDMPWELLQADYDAKGDPGENCRPSSRGRGSREVGSRHTDHSSHLAEIVVPLAEGIVRGRALVACPGWFLLMLLFLAATCLALIAEQGLLNAGLFPHFLNSKAWTFIKLGLIFPAALAALRGFFFSLFTRPRRNSMAGAS